MGAAKCPQCGRESIELLSNNMLDEHKEFNGIETCLGSYHEPRELPQSRAELEKAPYRFVPGLRSRLGFNRV